MDDVTKIEKYEDELSQLIQRMRKDGIREEVIHFILDQAARDSETKIIAKGELSPNKLVCP
jgi:DNA-binding transcriptional regulator YhcF (GntR family)